MTTAPSGACASQTGFMLVTTQDVQAAYDEWQLYLYDAERRWAADGQGEFLDALDDAEASGKAVGVADGLVDLLMPRRDHFAVSVTVEHHDSAPDDDAGAWDHVVEFPLPLPSGRLVLAASGGGGEVEVRLPADTYRGRWSGADMDGAVEWTYDDDGNPPDAYRLQVWPEPSEQAPTEVKRHPSLNRT